MNALARRATRKFRGIVLGHPIFAVGLPETWYRVRGGRGCVTAVPAPLLSREWMLTYVEWYKARGRWAQALALQLEWLASAKAARQYQ